MTALLAIPYMAWLSRMSGGGWPKLPYGLDQWFYALPYLALLWPVAGWWALAGYIGAMIGKRLPTAPWLDLGHATHWRANSISVLVDWLRGRVPEYWYDAAGLAVSGTLGTLAPAVLCCVYGFPGAAAALLASGAAKAPAYMIGWEIDRFAGWPEEVNESTEVAELLAGVYAGVGVAVAYYLMNL